MQNATFYLAKRICSATLKILLYNEPETGVLFISTEELQSRQNSCTSGGDHPGSVDKGASQRARLTGANKRMFNLLRKAKVQLIKIDQQKQLKSSGVRSLQSMF